MNKKDVFDISLRYVILLLLSISNIYLIYLIFTPLTVYPVFFLLNQIFHNAILQENAISFGDGMIIRLIPACIARAAYYLLLILNLSTPMKKITRVKSITFLLVSFLFLNILRILAFSLV